MSDSIHTTQDFSTNGITIPAGKVTTEMVSDLMKVPTDQAKQIQQELMAREGKYQEYLRGIHVKRNYTHNSGTMSVGGE